MEKLIHSAKYDSLATIRELPDDLKNDLPILLVNRKGHSKNAFMKTEHFIGHVEPNRVYQVTFEGFFPSRRKHADKLSQSKTPNKMTLRGEWNPQIDVINSDANILGGNGCYTLPKGNDFLTIPICKTTPEYLAYYGCQLVRIGDYVTFESNENLPVTITSVGDKYVDDYLLNPNLGGGAYLEVHDRPHFHMPMDIKSKGYLIIGKNNNGEKEISAFQIPYGFGVLMSPWSIHSDAHLIGRYMVIYSNTKKFSTVIIRKSNGDLSKINFL
ncbi:MAG: hypothetical protein ACWIPH_08635 [Ostreibacterium sp.]